MKIELKKVVETKDSTISRMYLNGVAVCYALEDGYREKKVKHQTRIPEGKYAIKFRAFGKMHSQYKSGHYGDGIKAMHKGMLWLQDVPNFDAILIHIGNTVSDTSGCILVGEGYSYNARTKLYSLIRSTAAYIRVYKEIAAALEKKEKVTINIER